MAQTNTAKKVLDCTDQYTCVNDGDCGIQRDIRLMLGDWRFPECKQYCDELYGLYVPKRLVGLRQKP